MNSRKVVYICNDDYVWMTGISMLSLMQHNRGIHIYVLGPDIKEESKARLRQLAESYDCTCSTMQLPEAFCRESGTSRWPVFTLARLFLADILPETIQKILYLDSDTIILNSLEKLWNHDMNGCLYCGVKDCISWRYKRNIGLEKDDDYINGGVLLADLAGLRKEDYQLPVRNFFKKHQCEISYFDQDVLNYLFHGKIGILPAEYNVMTVIAALTYGEMNAFRHPVNYYAPEELEYARENPHIIHFTQQRFCMRPWIRGSRHPYIREFHHYAKLYYAGTSGAYKQSGKLYQILLSEIIWSSPGLLRKCMLNIIGIFHSICLPETRHLKNEICFIRHGRQKGKL